MTAIIFCVALSGYDQVLHEDETTVRDIPYSQTLQTLSTTYTATDTNYALPLHVLQERLHWTMHYFLLEYLFQPNRQLHTNQTHPILLGFETLKQNVYKNI